MAKKLIEAENISKYYRLGILGSRSLKEDLKNWWAGKLKKSPEPDPENKQEIWALHDINFDVFQGEVLGLIGKNGAGKSTLLKIISRITLPTTGRISGNGRIASLLEVGTGFHGELTGRENIYLNGNIMGMKKKEIDRKFDEIIEFSGVSRFLDTPVKRYSSGMYVRLAFAVAAHLDPEILVIDEVLAVGDAEFQQKCMAKIKSISKEEGKTILFVSHNIQTIRIVCNRALALDKGKIIASGETESVLASYVKLSHDQFLGTDYSQQNNLPGNDYIRMSRVELIPRYLNQYQVIDIRTELSIRFEFIYLVEEAGDLMVILQVFSNAGELIFELASPNYTFKNGTVKGESSIPGNFLNDGLYFISLAFVRNSSTRIFYHESCLSFDVEDYKNSGSLYGKWAGVIRPSFPINLSQVSDQIL
ncbi:MAG TPA: polysaccharide ABC transporter ATP-binding protein [Puia sp.]